jgi:hypothetical protein
MRVSRSWNEPKRGVRTYAGLSCRTQTGGSLDVVCAAPAQGENPIRDRQSTIS